MQHDTANGGLEYIADPEDLAKAIGGIEKPLTWDTGILSPHTIFIAQRRTGGMVVEYRKPQITGIWLEGSEEAVRIPLPGLLLFRMLPDNDSARPDYLLFAVRRRPSPGKNAKLFNMPLPNTYEHGGICWGSVAAPPRTSLKPTTLEADWRVLLGSKFGDHAVNGKSRAFPKDIRKQLIALHDAKPARYPFDDLMPANKDLAYLLKHWGS